jgi:hypothetical protein
MPLVVSTTHSLLFVRYVDKTVVGPDEKEHVVKEAAERYRLLITPIPTIIPDWCKDTPTFKAASAPECGWLQVYTTDEAVGVTKSLGLQMATELNAATGGFAK